MSSSMNSLELDDDIQPLTTTRSAHKVTSRRHLGSYNPSIIRRVPFIFVLLILCTLLFIGAVYHHIETAESESASFSKSRWKILSPKPVTDTKTDKSAKYDIRTAAKMHAPKHEGRVDAKKNTSSLKSHDHTIPINATKHHKNANNMVIKSNTSIMLPNVLLIGAQKAGTTSIASLLHSNGICSAQVFPGEPEFYDKEVHFFDHQNRYDEGIEFYAKRFKKCARENKQFIMDATPNYLNQARRVYKTYTNEKAQKSAIKSLKLICILREPVSRELSLYNHKVTLFTQGSKDDWLMDVVHENSTIKTFDEYSDELAREIRSSPRGAFGLYVDHLKEWVEWFDRKNLLILSYDELLQEPSMVIQRIGNFLGINLAGSFSHENTSERPNKVKEVSLHAKQVLGSLFKDKNEELYKFIRDSSGPPMEQNPFPRFKDL